MRKVLILVSILVVAATAHAYTTGDWLCSGGACTLGASTATSTQLIGGGESISIGATTNEFLLTTAGSGTVLIKGADATGASNLLIDTSDGGTISIGSADVGSLSVDTVAGNMDLGATTSNTLTLQAESTGTAIFQGADAAGGADTQLDTTGIGTITIGSSQVSSIPVITDGGTLTIDGTIAVTANAVVVLASGALTDNTVHIATAAADYTLPACATATGNWVTVIAQDASEIISIAPASGDTIAVPGTSTVLGADDELDSAATADDAGDFVTLVCGAATKWYGISMGGVWTDGGAS